MDEDLRARAERRVLDAEQHARHPDAPASVRREAARLRDRYERALDRHEDAVLREIVEATLVPQRPGVAR